MCGRKTEYLLANAERKTFLEVEGFETEEFFNLLSRVFVYFVCADFTMLGDSVRTFIAV